MECHNGEIWHIVFVNSYQRIASFRCTKKDSSRSLLIKVAIMPPFRTLSYSDLDVYGNWEATVVPNVLQNEQIYLLCGILVVEMGCSRTEKQRITCRRQTTRWKRWKQFLLKSAIHCGMEWLLEKKNTTIHKQFAMVNVVALTNIFSDTAKMLPRMES